MDHLSFLLNTFSWLTTLSFANKVIYHFELRPCERRNFPNSVFFQKLKHDLFSIPYSVLCQNQILRNTKHMKKLKKLTKNPVYDPKTRYYEMLYIRHIWNTVYSVCTELSRHNQIIIFVKILFRLKSRIENLIINLELRALLWRLIYHLLPFTLSSFFFKCQNFLQKSTIPNSSNGY